MIDQPEAQAFVFDPVELSSIVDTMNGVGATPADLYILEALRQAGALRAELVIIGIRRWMK